MPNIFSSPSLSGDASSQFPNEDYNELPLSLAWPVVTLQGGSPNVEDFRGFRIMFPIFITRLSWSALKLCP